MNWVYRGRCWKFGDNIGIDGDMMPLEFALKRELDPKVLGPYLMSGIDPEFAGKVRPGDLIVAGKRFAQGNPHIQGFLGIRAHGLGLIAESIPRGSFRNAVNAGVPFLTNCAGVTEMVETGDDIEADFKSGLFVNHTRGLSREFPPLEAQLLDIIAIGGWRLHLERRVAMMKASQP
ncbi:MAG: 3-isopropylmalate dehydratase [Betaproteobacteria bacterium]|nr:3-isopropylmalate dehydratase [Betaproteobacteria bacterium]